MKVQFHIRGLNVKNSSRRWFEQAIERLQNLISITRAAVVLERWREAAPAFRASVLLAVPGPDIHAEARDYTLTATWLKVTTALLKQIKQRKAKQLARVKSAQPLIFISPWARGGLSR
jgi:ribosome-associated translation inhibitor RaiA